MKQKGHINFDTIHIKALISQGFDVKIVMHEEISNLMVFPMELYALNIPKSFDSPLNNSIVNRLYYILTLAYLKMKLSFRHYDYVIISNLDEISMGICPLNKHMYLFCHGNANDFCNNIKSFFLKKLSSNNTFLVFNKQMESIFLHHNILNTSIISHGCPTPYNVDTSCIKLLPLQENMHIVFHPSSKIDQTFLYNICNEQVNKNLKEQNVILVLRSNSTISNQFSNIMIINKYLTAKDYEYIYQKSDIILLAYPNNFANQVSGVSYECIANHKKLLALQNKSLLYCEQYFNYSPFFSTTAEMLNKITELLDKPNFGPIITAKDLIPNYKLIFNKKI